MKKAASEKKKKALKNIIRKTGSAKKLLYLNNHESYSAEILGKIK